MELGEEDRREERTEEDDDAASSPTVDRGRVLVVEPEARCSVRVRVELPILLLLLPDWCPWDDAADTDTSSMNVLIANTNNSTMVRVTNHVGIDRMRRVTVDDDDDECRVSRLNGG